MERLLKNEYTNQFMNKLREIKSNTGSLSRLDKYLELPINTNMEEIVETMNIKINNLKLLQKDRHNNNPEVNKLKQILDLSNIANTEHTNYIKHLLIIIMYLSSASI